MFDRFGAGVPSPFGVRGGILAIGVHAAILAYGLHGITGRADPARPYVAPESIWVIPQGPQHASSVPLPGAPDFGHITVGLPPIAVPPIPGWPMVTYPLAVSTGPVDAAPVGDPNGIYDSNVVEQIPELLSSPPPRYPEMLRMAHVEGVVVVQGVVDTLGHLEPKTLRVIESPHPALSASAIECLSGSVFRPGRVEGRAVRVLVQVPVRFTIANH